MVMGMLVIVIFHDWIVNYFNKNAEELKKRGLVLEHNANGNVNICFTFYFCENLFAC